MYLVKDVYHMHLDAKVGIYNQKDIGQKRISRILTSYSPEYLKHNSSSRLSEQENQRLFGCTVYPIVQPKFSFSNIKLFHKYMESLYEECGLSNKRVPTPRQNYKINSKEVVRLLPGETVLHKSHTLPNKSQPIHSEPNPNPKGNRYALIWDFKNIIKYNNKKITDYIPIPHETIIIYISVLKNIKQFKQRLQEVFKLFPNLIDLSKKYNAQIHVQKLIRFFQESNLKYFQ